MYKKISVLLLAAISVVACSSQSGKNGSGGNNNLPTNASVSFDPMTTVPVLNGNITKGVFYIHNYGTSAVNNISFSLPSQSATNAPTNAKSSTANMTNAAGLRLLNPEECNSIPAGGYCAVAFLTPNLAAGDSGNSLVSMSYSQNGETFRSNQTVSYKYIDMVVNKGVNFAGNVDTLVAQNKTRHVVAYIYAGGSAGTRYQNAHLQLDKPYPGIKVSQGFSGSTEMVSGEVIAVELAVNMQYNRNLNVKGYVSWDTENTGSKSAQNSKLSTEHGTLGQLSVDPVDKAN